MDKELQPGQVVWLKSGGPIMTVKYWEAGLWICSWFVSDNVHEHSFMAEQLTDTDPFPITF